VRSWAPRSATAGWRQQHDRPLAGASSTTAPGLRPAARPPAGAGYSAYATARRRIYRLLTPGHADQRGDHGALRELRDPLRPHRHPLEVPALRVQEPLLRL